MLKKLLVVVPTIVLLVASVFVAPTVKAQTANKTSYSSVTITLNNVKVKDLYALTANVMNDYKWYPGIASTTLVSSGVRPPVGNKYLQKVNLGGSFTLDVNIEVLSAVKNLTYNIKGTSSVLEFNAFYIYHPSRDGAKLTMLSKLTAPGLTEASRRTSLMNSYNGLFTYFNTTGDVHIDYLRIVD